MRRTIPPRLPQLLAALAAGIATPLAFAPWHWSLLLPALLAVPFACVLHTRTLRDGLWVGAGYGVGLFGAGVGWIHNSFFAYGPGDPLIAALGTGGLILVLAGFPLLALGLAGAWLRHRAPSWRDGLVLAASWVMLEWLRCHVAGGFPWLLLGLSQDAGPLRPLLPVGGTLLTGLVLAWTAALPGLLLLRAGGAWMALGVTLLASGGLVLLPPDWTRPAGEPVSVALVQPNVRQSIKWHPGHLLEILDDTMEQIEAVLDARLVVLPETALPEYQQNLQDMLQAIDQEAAAAGSTVVLGLPWHAGGRRFHNALLVLGSEQGRYFKRHLVPVGEYTPWASLWPGLSNPIKRRLPDFSPGPARQPPLQLAGHPAAASICYEDAYPGLWRREAARAHFLVNVSNDGFFGDPLASAQHLQISRVRALEFGKPLLRATNTGISALIGPHGTLHARLDHGPGVLRGRVQPHVGMTPYARLGDLPALALAGFALLAGFRGARRGTALAAIADRS